MDGMHGTQSDHAHLDLLLLDIWLCAFWHITRKLCRAQCWIKSILTFTLSRPHSLTFIYYYNRQQNELRHFALNWAFLHFTDFNKRKYSFSSLIPSMQCSADVQATYRKQQTPQLWTEGAEEGCKFFCSLNLPYLSTMSQLFCRSL